MADAGKAEKSKLPSEMHFDSGFLSDTATLNSVQMTGKLDESLRSYMDKGDDVLFNEQGRRGVIDGVRNTILARLRNENALSFHSATAAEADHDRFTMTEMYPLIKKLQDKKRAEKIKTAKYLLAKKRRVMKKDKSQQRVQNIASPSDDIDVLIRQQGDDWQNVDQAVRALPAGQTSLPAAVQPGQPVVPPAGVAGAMPPAGARPAGGMPPAGPVGAVPPAGAAGAMPPAGARPAGGMPPAGAAGAMPPVGGMPPAGAGPAGAMPPAGAGPAGAMPPAGAAGPGGPGPAGPANPPQPVELVETKETAEARHEDLLALNKIRDEMGALKGWSFNTRHRESTAKEDQDKAIADTNKAKNELAQKLTDKATEWDKRRQKYRDTTYLAHYNRYDDMASAYYRFTRELQVPGQPGPDINTMPGASKNIAEYIGIYDVSQFARLGDAIVNNPYAEVRFLKKESKKISTDSLNAMDANRLIKFHKTIVMMAFGENTANSFEEEKKKTTRIRKKMLSNFRGYTAKKQFKNGKLEETNQSSQNRGKMTPAELAQASQPGGAPVGMAAAGMNLVDDEKGSNGAYLFSEKSAKIYQVKRKDGQTVEGFYLNGKFYSKDYSALTDESQIKSSSELGHFEKKEALRNAIHKSDFFRHVNSGTIQYYMTYNPDDEFGAKDIENKVMGGAAQQQSASPINKIALMIKAYEDPQANANAVRALAAMNITVNQDATGLAAIKTEAINLATSASREDIRNLGVLLLSGESPDLWTVAREMAQHTVGKFGGKGRFNHRLKHIPTAGEAMRIALMEEFARDRSIHWGSIDTYADLPRELMPDNLQMHIEDLNAKRDGFFSFTNLKQSFWDGSLFSAIIGNFSLEGGGARRMDFTHAKNQYADDLENVNEKIAFLPRDIATEGIQDAAEYGEAINEDAFKAGSTGSIVKAVSYIYSSVKGVINVLIKARDLINAITGDDPVFPALMDLFEAVADLFYSIANLITCFVSDDWSPLTSGVAGVIKDIAALTRNGVNIIRSIIERVRIHNSRKNISTAMTDAAAEIERLRQANPNGAIDENSFGNDKLKMGYVASRNTQGEYFLKMARKRTKRTQITQSFDVVKNTISLAGNAVAIDSVAKDFDPRTWAFTLASKAVGFIGWCVGKAYDKHNSDDILRDALGDDSVFKWFNTSVRERGAFDKILERETGIKNKHYITDVSKIFMAIDTHNIVRKSGKSGGETALVTNLMSPYLKMAGDGDQRYNQQNKATNEGYFQKVRLNKLLEAVGGPSNWRAVLRSAITG